MSVYSNAGSDLCRRRGSAGTGWGDKAVTKNWRAFGWIVAPVALVLAFIARSQGAAWFLVVWVLVMAWVVVGWLIILPRWQKAQPLAKKFASAPGGPVPAAELWEGTAAVRFPSGLGGLNASTPLVRLIADANGVHLGPTLKWMSFIPSLSLPWAALERIEAVGNKGVRLRIKDPTAAVLVLRLHDRDGLLNVGEQQGVAVDRSHRPYPWFTVG